MRHLTKKIVRKIKSIISKTIPHNIAYRPVGVYETAQEYIVANKANQPKYKELYPAYKSEIAIDAEFYSKCADYMDLPLEADFPASYILQVPGGRLHTDTIGSVAIISHDNKLIGGVSY